MFDDLHDLYQQVILDHSRSPRNYRKIDPADRVSEGRNPLCGDKVTVYLAMEGETIKDVAFQGEGCAISKASASIMTEMLKGKSKDEAKKLFEQFHEMITTGTPRIDELGKLGVFAGVNKFPTRVKCASLAWHAVVATLEGKENVVSTE